MKKTILGAWMAICFVSTNHGQGTDFSIVSFGAKGGGLDATQAIQTAISTCSKAGGGRVLVPAGRYLTSTLRMESNVEFHLASGAELLASRNPADYTQTKGIYSTETDVPCLFLANGLKNISFTGAGLIHGQAEHDWADLKEVDNFIRRETELARAAGIEMKRAYARDPKVCLFYITDCQNVRFTDLTIRDSPNWAVHIAHCNDVAIRSISLYSSLDKGVNSDGLDIDGCRNVRISDCHVETGDDAICLKSTQKNGIYFPCENITVTNCTLISTSTALKIGTESHGDFRNIVFSNSVISNTNRGIGIFVRDGATVNGVIFSNLVIECKRKHFNWWGDGDPIRFVLLKRKPDSRLGRIQNVLVSQVRAKGEGTSLIAGFDGDKTDPARSLQNIVLRDVQIDQYPESLPDTRSDVVLRTSKLEGLTLEACHFRFSGTGQEKNRTQVLSLEQVKNAVLNQCSLFSPSPEKPLLALTSVQKAQLTGLAFPTESCLMKIEGADTKEINLDWEGESDQKPCIRIGKEVPKKAVRLD